MNEENLMPNDGEFFTPFKQAEKQAKEQKVSGRAELRKAIERLQGRIDATDSVKQTLELAETYEISREEALIVCDIVRQQLENERGILQSVLDM